MPAARILIVEDEESLAHLVAEALKRQGYECSTVFDGDSALEAVWESLPDLIVLDVMLPRLDGFEVTRRIREDRTTREIPIIMLTARREEEDVLAGFEAGANDYMRKPFSIGELLARVKTQLGRKGAAHAAGNGIVIGPLRIDTKNEEAYLCESLLDLSITEYRLLETLALAGGHTVSRGDLLRKVWGMQMGDTRTLDVHMFRLRRKVEEKPDMPELLHTVRGRGYKLAVKPADLKTEGDVHDEDARG